MLLCEHAVTLFKAMYEEAHLKLFKNVKTIYKINC